ncbi:hypothetical protein [Rhodococcus sp. HS-D2]|uniref:hypothetical protein n=1 Tax=Rhodococcus sp. HS-D2 TaxID=1384636 RepID=UPI0007D9D809|nr:hypothetical protein [Rhodococcus sp. HS-D2]
MSDQAPLIVPTSWIQDSSVSFAARGLLIEIARFGHGHEANVAELTREGQETEDEVRGLLDELTKAGYLRDGRIIAEW